MGDYARPGRRDRLSTFRYCFHIIARIVRTLFRAIGATRAIGAITWKPRLTGSRRFAVCRSGKNRLYHKLMSKSDVTVPIFVGCLRDARESSLATTQQSLITPDDKFRVHTEAKISVCLYRLLQETSS